MNEEEFELIDELYFIKNFNQLRKDTLINEQNLIDLIFSLVQKKWVKCLENENEIEIPNMDFFIQHLKSLSFNVSKEGLKAHHNM